MRAGVPSRVIIDVVLDRRFFCDTLHSTATDSECTNMVPTRALADEICDFFFHGAKLEIRSILQRSVSDSEELHHPTYARELPVCFVIIQYIKFKINPPSSFSFFRFRKGRNAPSEFLFRSAC